MRNTILLTIALAAPFQFVLQKPLYAEVLTLRNGKVITGKVVGVTESDITFSTDSELKSIPKNNIKKIQFDNSQDTLIEEKKSESKIIETIGSHEITTNEYEAYYNTYIEKAARYANTEKSTLSRFMCQPEQDLPDKVLQDLITKIKPENNYAEYRQMRIVEQAAIQEGFATRPMIKKIMEQVMLETLFRLFIQEKMNSRMNITLEQKKSKCNVLRKKYPDRVGNLNLDSCLYIAEGFLRQEYMFREEDRLSRDITKSVRITKNKGFNRKEYLKKNFELYQEMKKNGGCEEE